MLREIRPVRNTRQRKHLLELLQSTKSHPNALWLYEHMLPLFPHLSLSTVYRNLSILESQGMIQRLSCGGSFDRYDADTSMHSHFHCRECGQLYDLNAGKAEQNALDLADSGSHRLEGCQVTFYGCCERCLSIKNNQE